MTLAHQLVSPTSLVRRFLADAAFSFDKTRWNTAFAGIRPVLAPAHPVGSPIPYALLGHAIGARIAWRYGPVAGGVLGAGAKRLAGQGASVNVLDALGAALSDRPPADEVRAARLAWFAGLCDQAFRSGRWDAEWYRPLFDLTDLESALDATPDWWIADIVAVASKSQAILPGTYEAAATVGATFAGSSGVGGADADLIVDGLLVDIKAVKEPQLRARDLHQVLCYALLDWDDAYELTAVALASVRFGVLVRWELDEVVAGGTKGLEHLRDELRTIIVNDEQDDDPLSQLLRDHFGDGA